MSIEKYLFWDMIRSMANNVDNVTEYKEKKWIENICFKENLNDGIKIFDNLLENRSRLNCTTKK